MSGYFYDGSYLRLKNAEVAYQFNSGWINKIGLQSLRVYVSGNNLLLWTDMPDDREANFAGTKMTLVFWKILYAKRLKSFNLSSQLWSTSGQSCWLFSIIFVQIKPGS